MTLQIMNCYDDKIDVDIGELEEIRTISITVLSGDEILKATKKNGENISEDSDRHARCISFFDGEYTIFDSDTGVNLIEEWKNRKDSNDWIM